MIIQIQLILCLKPFERKNSVLSFLSQTFFSGAEVNLKHPSHRKFSPNYKKMKQRSKPQKTQKNEQTNQTTKAIKPMSKQEKHVSSKSSKQTSQQIMLLISSSFKRLEFSGSLVELSLTKPSSRVFFNVRRGLGGHGTSFSSFARNCLLG